jgi:hypothetical protein
MELHETIVLILTQPSVQSIGKSKASAPISVIVTEYAPVVSQEVVRLRDGEMNEKDVVVSHDHHHRDTNQGRRRRKATLVLGL